jgi:hypothetical protein
MALAGGPTGVSRTGETVGVRLHHGLHSCDAGPQAEAIEANAHSLPSLFEASRQRDGTSRGILVHGVAFLCGISTPSLPAQGEQRLLSFFNIGRDIPD